MRLRALIRAGHPGPSVAITVMIVLLALPGRAGLAATILFALAALSGELSIGWSNDAFDASADAAAARVDKPIVSGSVSRRAVALAALVALVASLVLAVLVSPPTGLINLVMLAAGWAYNAGLKATVYSGLMYVIGFGLIPAFAASTFPGHPLPRPWTTAAAALLGLGGHFANVLPDLRRDQVSGVSGLPQRVAGVPGGRVAVRVVTFALLLGASAMIVLGPGGAPRWWHIAGLVTVVALAGVGALRHGRTPFIAAVTIALIDVILFVSRGAALV